MRPKRVTVLLVDDNPADSDLMSDVLSNETNASVVYTAPDGVEALAYLRQQEPFCDATSPDLILLDLNLPRKDGRAVLGEIRSDPELWLTPVVIFSASQADSDIASAYELGANSYVSKPGTLPEFRATVATLAKFWFHCACFLERENL